MSRNPLWILVLIPMVLFVQGDDESDDIPQNLLNNYKIGFLENQLVLSLNPKASLQVKAVSWSKKSTKGLWVKLSTYPSLIIDKNGIYKCKMLYNKDLVKELEFVVINTTVLSYSESSFETTTEISEITASKATTQSITESKTTTQSITESKTTTQSITEQISKIVEASTVSVTETTTESKESSSVQLGIWSYVGIGTASLIVIVGIILTFYLLYKRKLICSEREPANFPRVEISHSERTLSRTSVDFLPVSTRSSNRRPRGESNASSGSGEYMYNNPGADVSDSPTSSATTPSNQLSLTPTENTFRRMSSRNLSKASLRHSQMAFQEPLDDSILTDDPQFQPGKLSLLV